MMMKLTASCHSPHVSTGSFNVATKALRKTVFTEIFVFASFGNRCFSNFGNISVMSKLFELVPTLIFAKKHNFSRKNCKKTSQNEPFFEN